MAKIIVDKERCKGCSLCIPVCPREILAISDTVINEKGYHPMECTDMDACIGCANCARMCPDVCITVER